MKEKIDAATQYEKEKLHFLFLTFERLFESTVGIIGVSM